MTAGNPGPGALATTGHETAHRLDVTAQHDLAAEHGPDAHHPGASSVIRRDILDGPLNTRQLVRLEEALRLADSSTGLLFSVYLGELSEPSRLHAEKMLGQLADPARAVLVAVSPNQRILEIVTGGDARRRIPDRACKLAALSMSAAFSGGDLGGGIVSGIAQLVEHAGKNRS